MDPKIETLALSLHEIGAVKFGEFKLKSGILSPIYIDFRLIVSYPDLLKTIGELIWAKIASLKFELICGVPYTALPIATAISLSHRVPMVMRRKEVKAYGTGKLIEGAFTPHMKCLVIDDLITSGLSIFETITPLEEVNITVEDIVVLLDREQGGKKSLEDKGYQLHALFTLRELLHFLRKEGKITLEMQENIHRFLKGEP